MVYYIRPFEALSPEHFQQPRTPESVRRSLDGTLCVLAFDDGTQPDGWDDGMDETSFREHLNSPESEGVWYTNDIM